MTEHLGKDTVAFQHRRLKLSPIGKKWLEKTHPFDVRSPSIEELGNKKYLLIEAAIPKKEHDSYVLYRAIDKKRWEFVKRRRSLSPFPFRFGRKHGFIPVSGNARYLFENYYDYGKPIVGRSANVVFLKITVPPKTRVFYWEGGYHIGLPYAIPLSRVKALSNKDIVNEVNKFPSDWDSSHGSLDWYHERQKARLAMLEKEL